MQNANMDKDRIGFEYINRGVFGFNDKGDIFRCKRKLPGKDEFKEIEPRLIKSKAHGYSAVSITWGTGKYGYIRGHRLVWMNSNEKLIPKGYDINHKDGNKANNAPENLELVTRAENSRAGKNTKLDYLKVKKIRELRDNGVSHREIAEMFKVCQGTISCIINNRIWKDV